MHSPRSLLPSVLVCLALVLSCRGCSRGEEPTDAVEPAVKPKPKPKPPQWTFVHELKEEDHEPGGLARQGAFAFAEADENGTGTLLLFASSAEDELSTGALGLRHLLQGTDGGYAFPIDLDGGEYSPGLARWAGQRLRLYRGSSFACLGEVIGLRALVPPSAPHDKRALGTGAAVVAVVRPEGNKCEGASWGRWATYPVPAMAAPLEKVAPTEAKRLEDKVLEAFRAMPSYQAVQERYLAQVRAEEEANKTRATELETNDAVEAVLAPAQAAAGSNVVPEDLGAPGSAAAARAQIEQISESPERYQARAIAPQGSEADDPDTAQVTPEEPLSTGSEERPATGGQGSKHPEELRWDAPARHIRPAIGLWRMVKADRTYAAAYSKTGSCAVPGGELGALFEVMTEGGDTSFVLWEGLPELHLPRALFDLEGDGALEILDDQGLFQQLDGGYRRVQSFPPTSLPDGGC